jgi:hypothetical protein
VPANGHIDRSGDGWDCERGFRKQARSCVAVEVPANAHLGYRGASWACDSGYRQRGRVCTEDE